MRRVGFNLYSKPIPTVSRIERITPKAQRKRESIRVGGHNEGCGREANNIQITHLHYKKRLLHKIRLKIFNCFFIYVVRGLIDFKIACLVDPSSRDIGRSINVLGRKPCVLMANMRETKKGIIFTTMAIRSRDK